MAEASASTSPHATPNEASSGVSGTPDEDEAFEDALECMPRPSMPMDCTELHVAIAEAITAMDLFFNNKFTDAKLLFQKCADSSMYHALGYATIMYMQAGMTFQPADIEAATSVVKSSLQVCNRYRRRGRLVDNFYRRKNFYDDLTAAEVHAEICYAECLLERALLTFIQDENLISFIKGSFKVKECYNSYKEGVQLLKNRTWKDDDEKIHFESGVHLGIGMFSLLISQLPSRIMKLLEFVGFSGNKEHGLSELELGASLKSSMRGPLCSMFLIGYHTFATYVFGTGEGDLELSGRLLRQCLSRYPRGALFLYLSGRLDEVSGKIDEAIQKFEDSIDSQSEWKQFHHMCFWELMWCYCFKADWLFAMKYAERLLNESRWSRSTYCCLKASFLLMYDDISDETDKHITYLMQQVPVYKQRIAGKSLPVEKFAVKKAERYFAQDHRLTLPAYEMMYIWNGFAVVADCPQVIETALQTVDKTIVDLNQEKNTSRPFYFDDLCLAKLLRGVCLRHQNKCDEAELCFRFVKTHEKDIQDDKYLIPYSQVEIAMMYLHNENYDKAKELLQQTKHNYKGYSLESRLHFRIHAGLNQVKTSKSVSHASVSSSSSDATGQDTAATAAAT